MLQDLAAVASSAHQSAAHLAGQVPRVRGRHQRAGGHPHPAGRRARRRGHPRARLRHAAPARPACGLHPDVRPGRGRRDAEPRLQGPDLRHLPAAAAQAAGRAFRSQCRPDTVPVAARPLPVPNRPFICTVSHQTNAGATSDCKTAACTAQVGVFSATLPPEALEITRKFMNKPVHARLLLLALS